MSKVSVKGDDRYTPAGLFDKFEGLREGVTRERFFNDPANAKIQEMWCAARFGLGYKLHFEEVYIHIAETDIQLDYDFQLEVNGRLFPFQVTEVQIPGRARGLEYKRPPEIELVGEEAERGAAEGCDWIREGIKKKYLKYLDGSGDLNLLVYANFYAWDQHYEDLVNCCEDLARNFESVWVLVSDRFCCIKENELLKKLEGWGNIDSHV